MFKWVLNTTLDYGTLREKNHLCLKYSTADLFSGTYLQYQCRHYKPLWWKDTKYTPKHTQK